MIMATAPPVKIHFALLFFILLSTFITPFSISFASDADFSIQQKNPLKNSNKISNNHYAFERCRSLQAKAFDTNSKKKKLIIIGDSQGCDFLNEAIENGYLKNYQIQFRFIPYACQTIPNENINDYISKKYQNYCLKTKHIDSLKKAKQQVNEADVVVFSPLWKAAVANKLPKIFHYLGIKKQQRLIVIGYKFFGKITPSKYINLSNHERRLLRNEVGKKSLEINAILSKRLGKNVTFINPHQLVCGDSTNCPVFTSDLKLISYDGRHLTKAGARYIGKILFKNTMLGSI